LPPDTLAAIVKEAIDEWFEPDKLDAQLAHEHADRDELMRALPA
jgi:hypothetical protein